MSIEVKAVSEAELPELIRVVLEKMPDIPYYAKKDPEILIPKWTQLMRMGIARSYGAYEDGTPIGMLLGMVTADLVAATTQAFEIAWQVRPEYRRRGAGIQLLKLFEQDAVEAGCARIVFGASMEGYGHEAMIRLYRRLGYEPFSTVFAKKL